MQMIRLDARELDTRAISCVVQKWHSWRFYDSQSPFTSPSFGQRHKRIWTSWSDRGFMLWNRDTAKCWMVGENKKMQNCIKIIPTLWIINDWPNKKEKTEWGRYSTHDVINNIHYRRTTDRGKHFTIIEKVKYNSTHNKLKYGHIPVVSIH